MSAVKTNREKNALNRLPHLNKEIEKTAALPFCLLKNYGEKSGCFPFLKAAERTKTSLNRREKEKGINSEMFIFAEEKQGRILEQQYIDPG